MKFVKTILVLVLIITLASCGESGPIYNFSPRKDTYLVSEDKQIMIYYKTDNDGKMIELSIDRLLSIEEMILMNPIIDFEYTIEGFVGDIYMQPKNTCTAISNDGLIPINIEVGNTRYKFDNDECMYKTVDNHNEFKSGYAEEYLLTDTIPVASHVTISIIVYNPLGVYNIIINRDRDGFTNELANYYRDVSIYEQLYLKHQENENALNEISGISNEINLLDINSLTDVNPLIDNFELIYDLELIAIAELQVEIGETFEIETESIVDEEPVE